MSTNDTIIGVVNKGSFRFPVEFDMFGIHQYIDNVTFDTGCSHSLISVKSLNLGNKLIEELKRDALFDADVTLIIGKGIESADIDTRQLQSDILKINEYKKLLKAAGKSKQEMEIFFKENVSKEIMERVLSSQLVRYDYMALNYTIDGVKIGNFKVRVSFDLGKANLIGMHIIRELYTKIFSVKGKVCLFAKKNSELAEVELDRAKDVFREQLELMDKLLPGI